MAVLQSFRTAPRIATETPVFVAFVLTLRLVGALNNTSSPAGVIGSLLQLLAVPALTGAFYTVTDGVCPDSDTDLCMSTTVQRYYVSLFGAMLLAGLVVFVVAVVAGDSVLDYVGFDRLNAVLNGSANLTPTELAVSGVVLVVLMAVIYVFTLFDTAVVLDGQTTDGSLSRSVNFVLSSLRAIVGYAVVMTAVTSVANLPVLWFVTLDGATTVIGAATASQVPMSMVDITIVAAGSTVTMLVGRTYKVCFCQTYVDAAPGVDPGSGDGKWTA